MEFSRKIILIIEPPEVSAEYIRVHQLAEFICEDMIAHLKATLLSLTHFLVAVAAENVGHIFTEIDHPGLTVFRGSLDHPLSRN
ncbi:hypothetical protein AALA80_17140 [Oscillospiraceae bacterium 50-60]